MTQKVALDILKTGASVFLTGSAGSGKTYVLNEYIRFLRMCEVSVAITASTGIAATHIGGTTIHSWSGIGVRSFLTEADIDVIESKQYLYKRLTTVSVLIIDEISMLHRVQLDMLDMLLRQVRRNDAPFGGVQMVFCGDFFQLPPVVKNREVETHDFVFSAASWASLDPVVCYLTEQYRQTEGDLQFILNEVRTGIVSEKSYELLESKIQSSDTDNHTKLYTHNIDVDALNTTELEKIDNKEYVYEMHSTGKELLVESLMKTCLAPQKLILKKDCKVMFVKNDPEQKYVNGTLGIVEDFLVDGTPVVRTLDGRKLFVSALSWAVEEDGKVKASITQLPLRLAWAITIHKSQGMSLDAAEVDLSKAFTYGQGYVALSRLRTLDGLSLIALGDDAFLLHPAVKDKDIVFQELSSLSEHAYLSFSEDDILERHKNFIKKVHGTWKEESEQKKDISFVSKDTYQVTKQMLDMGKTINEVVTERSLTLGTILNHLEVLQKRRLISDFSTYNLIDQERLKIIVEVFQELKVRSLTPVFEYLKKADFDTTYEELRIARLFLSDEDTN